MNIYLVFISYFGIITCLFCIFTNFNDIYTSFGPAHYMVLRTCKFGPRSGLSLSFNPHLYVLHLSYTALYVRAVTAQARQNKYMVAIFSY